MPPAVPTPEAAAPNLARALVRAGLLLAIALPSASVIDAALDDNPLRAGAGVAAIYGVGALLLTLLARAIADACFLGQRMREELARGNVAAGIVSAAHLVAAGHLASRSFYGADLSTLPIATAFFAITTATLLALQAGYRAVTRYADDEEVAGENVAAAIAFAGLTIALAIIVGHAAEGSFQGWGRSLRAYGLALVLGVALLPVRSLLVRVLVGWRGRGTAELDAAIAQRADVVVACIEAMAYVGTGLLAAGIG